MKDQKETILVSACLLGVNCRYDGNHGKIKRFWHCLMIIIWFRFVRNSWEEWKHQGLHLSVEVKIQS